MPDTVVQEMPSPFPSQLRALLEMEAKYQPKSNGLRIIESAHDSGFRITSRLRDFEVKDLLSLSQFFGLSTETFSLAVNLLDRFLSIMKVQPKHLSCVALCCFYLAIKSTEDERNIPLASDLIRIAQRRFTVSDMMRMEKIILEKLYWKIKAVTVVKFLRLYLAHVNEHSLTEQKKLLNTDRLEAQLKACHCRLMFSKAKPSLLALAILSLEIQEQKLHELRDVVQNLQQFSMIADRDLFVWREMVAKCLAEYASPKCTKPNHQKLKWVVSGRTAQQLKHSYYRIAHLPTIPEALHTVETGSDPRQI
ncbi:cyclin-G1 [Erpetoichthys calabaricus]|uniref:Cyclin G1 n=1 Tax=Erpetoichthys calabaricus TaxID=27687 RepID=A0A8C4SQ86_ERPCA|nr:cyclin-G1 [Erpetoichthys calabaricus]